MGPVQKNQTTSPDYERRMNEKLIEIERIRNDTKQIEKETEQLERETEQIKKETDQIKKETEQLRQVNSRLRALNASVRQLCFPPESSSMPQTPTAPDCRPSSP
jgi:predicted RNase H-like nuclease (RuvC/YqgF family)